MPSRDRWYVYTLADPTTGAVRYVGKSKNPRQRIASHRSRSGARPMREWLAVTPEPVLEIVSTHDDEYEALYAEQEMIHEMRLRYPALLNAKRDGKVDRLRQREALGIPAHDRRRKRRVTRGSEGLSAAIERRQIGGASAAALLGVVPRDLWVWLQGDAQPSTVQVAMIRNEFGVPIEWWDERPVADESEAA